MKFLCKGAGHLLIVLLGMFPLDRAIAQPWSDRRCSGLYDQLVVAIPAIGSDSAEAGRFAEDIGTVITRTIDYSGKFQAARSFVEEPVKVVGRPNFDNWRVLNVQVLVAARTSVKGNGELQVEFRLWDVFAETAMTGVSLSTSQSNWKRIARMVSAQVYESASSLYQARLNRCVPPAMPIRPFEKWRGAMIQFDSKDLV